MNQKYHTENILPFPLIKTLFSNFISDYGGNTYNFLPLETIDIYSKDNFKTFISSLLLWDKS
jgi:hypothetical protein